MGSFKSHLNPGPTQHAHAPPGAGQRCSSFALRRTRRSPSNRARSLCDLFIAEQTVAPRGDSFACYYLQLANVSVKASGTIMEPINNTEIESNSGSPLPPPPQFDSAMVSGAQQVEPLDANGTRTRWPLSSRNFFRGRLGVLAVVLTVLLLGAAAFGMFLGLRDQRQRSVQDATTASETTPEPTSTGESAVPLKSPPVKAPPVKASVRTQKVQLQEPLPKPVSPPERVRRSMRATLDEFDRALSQGGQKPAPRKVGEIFGSGRNSRKGESRRRERDDNQQ